MTHPLPKKIPVTTKHFGDTLTDNYDWLRDKGWPDVQNQEILNHLRAENAYYEQAMMPQKDAVDGIFTELKSRIKLDDETVPVLKGEYLYFTRTIEDLNYPIYIRKHKDVSSEQVVLDPNKLAEGLTYFKLGCINVSEDHNILAYSVDVNGGERFQVRIKMLDANETHFADVLENTHGSVIWDKKGEGFFYTKMNEQWRSLEVYYHKLKTSQQSDRLVYKEDDIRFHVDVSKSSSRRFLFINIECSNSSETRYIDLTGDMKELKLLKPRIEERLYSVSHHGDYFYIMSNDTGRNFRLVKKLINGEEWQEIRSTSQEAYLTSQSLYQTFYALTYKVEGLARIYMYDYNDQQIHQVEFQDPCYDADVDYTSYEDENLRIDYSSLNQPGTILEINTITKAQVTRKVTEVPFFDAKLFQSERVFAKSHDGKKVPISLVYRKDLYKKDGSNPLYLYAYGSYGYSIPPAFKSHVLPMLDRGFIYAIAHIRGGDDLGYEWYEDGKLLHKKNTFLDYHAAAKHLINECYTAAKKIVISGRSAGGILVGYCLNEYSELFGAAIASVPFVDVLNTMLDESLPLTPGEYNEWGNPKLEKFYHYIKSFSPYDNIKKQAYPPIYVTAGLNDPRVTYWEPAKWIAKLREYKTNDNPILFEINLDSGHAGNSGRFGYLKDMAKEYSFIFDALL